MPDRARAAGHDGARLTGRLPAALAPYRYVWPVEPWPGAGWRPAGDDLHVERRLPESRASLAADSRWPALFPSPVCLVTSSDGRVSILERVVGPSIVNRFPYVLALSFCREPLSARHYVRRTVASVIERSGSVAVQLLPPGPALDRALQTITDTPEDTTAERVSRTGLPTRPALQGAAPVFDDAYLVYEARLVSSGRDLEGQTIYRQPWIDVGSHRVYFLEVTAIQLREDVAAGRRQILWRSLPAWQPTREVAGAPRPAGDAALPLAGGTPPVDAGTDLDGRYRKGYTPHYAFPSAGTIAFEADAVQDGMAIKRLPPEAADQVEVDNDRARWPCFFPSSVGMITTWAPDGRPNLMPCGSTTVVSRHPMVIAPCVGYAAINERYAPRQSLELIRRRGAFGCGVPYISDRIVAAITYAGNISLEVAGDKLARAGLAVRDGELAPVLPDLPVHFECEVTGEVRLGTHVMFLGEVKRILARADVSPVNPIEWCPWPALGATE